MIYYWFCSLFTLRVYPSAKPMWYPPRHWGCLVVRVFRRLQNWLLVRQYACVPKKVADGTLVASSQPPPFIPSLLSQFSQSPSLKRCGRDGMRSDSTKTFHNGFDFGPSSSTFRAFSILHPSQLHF